MIIETDGICIIYKCKKAEKARKEKRWERNHIKKEWESSSWWGHKIPEEIRKISTSLTHLSSESSEI